MPTIGCVRHPRIQGRGTHVRMVAVAVLLVLASTVLTAGVAAAGTEPRPERCERDGTGPRRCVGPVTDESGGGGDVLTIALSVGVGLAIAGVAFVLVRKQLAGGGGRAEGRAA